MHKAEPQHGQTQALHAAQRQRGALPASPQAQRLAGLAAMMNAGPGMAAQRRLADAIHDSPRQAAQRRQFASLFGTAQRVQEEEPPAQAKPDAQPNQTGLPHNLKHGIESLSGVSMDAVRVHYNSSRSAQLNALAYAQGTDIHVAPGQEKHLPHEAWHVVQQAQGRVEPTMQLQEGVAGNDDRSLEREADVMGTKAMQLADGGTRDRQSPAPLPQRTLDAESTPFQRVIAAHPVAVNQAGLIAAGGAPMDMGSTDPIANAVVPTYNIVTNAVHGGFEATVVKTANAYEGDSRAVYLQRGIYPSGLMLVGGNLANFVAGPGNRQVYADLLQATSNLSRMAEQEHLDDLRRAFQITLGLADWALDQAVLHGPYGVYASAPLAQAAAETAINHFIAARAALLGTAAFLMTANLGQLYQNKQALTQANRDGLGFHTFDLDRVHQSNSPLAWGMYLLTFLPGVENKDFREVIPGPNFQVPGPPSNVVIT